MSLVVSLLFRYKISKDIVGVLPANKSPRPASGLVIDTNDAFDRNEIPSNNIVADGPDAIDPFEAHPECALLREPLSIKKALVQYGKYGRATRGPRYDHTCFMLKPRYNCARNESATIPGDMPPDYALGLRDPQRDNQTVCSLQDFVHDAGGPAGIGRLILENYRKRRDNANAQGPGKKDLDSEVVEVLFLGTSRFRQVWESMVCAYRDQIGNFSIAKPKIKPEPERVPWLDGDDLGARVSLDSILNGDCYNPRNYLRCSDNVAQVEFFDTAGTTIRFSYVYRPWSWKDPALAFRRLGMDLRAKPPVDFLFYETIDGSNVAWEYGKLKSGRLESLYKDLFDLRTPIRLTAHSLRRFYVQTMKRDLGKYYGPDNPWITHPPDKAHGCMPGMGDDTANLILWHMLSLSALPPPLP